MLYSPRSHGELRLAREHAFIFFSGQGLPKRANAESQTTMGCDWKFLDTLNGRLKLHDS